MRLTKGIAGLVCATCAAAAGILSYAGAAPIWLDGLLFDAGLALRARMADEPSIARHVAVVAVDPESLDAPELASLPRTFFGPAWGETITALRAAGAKSIAFDFLLSYSANRFDKGFDRPFMAALYRNRERVVLGRSARSLPARNYLAALRNDPASLGMMDVSPDADKVYRSIRSTRISDDGKAVPTLAGAALYRAGARSIPEEIILAPTAHPEITIPTYSLISVLRCAKSDPDALGAAFAGRAVFVGSTIPEEDRKVSSARFIEPASHNFKPVSACGLVPKAAPSAPGADNVPGVHLHAIAAEAALSGQVTRRAPPEWPAVTAGAAALAGGVIGFALSPLWASLVVILLAAGLWLGEIGMLGARVWLPVGFAMLSVIGAGVIAYVVRFLLEEARRRRIQKAFSFYLAPSLVDRMVDSAEPLHLGGEMCDVTIMFADLSGFTALSEKVGPKELVTRTNEYLTLIADEVEATGGYVDKFIGDAVMAVWGAPVRLDDHAEQAVAAAIRIGDRIAEQREQALAAGEHGFAVKIGVNTGDAVVGNVGSEKRFNYTAVGEAVNVAARLEGLPGVYDCRIVLGEKTAQRVRDRFRLREIDMVTVKGKEEPLHIFEPVEGRDESAATDYDEALTLYRARSFARAATIWDRVGDGPSAVMAERARAFEDSPPPASWNGVWIMTSK